MSLLRVDGLLGGSVGLGCLGGVRRGDRAAIRAASQLMGSTGNGDVTRQCLSHILFLHDYGGHLVLDSDHRSEMTTHPATLV